MHNDTDDIKITVFGTAQPAGSKRAYVHPHTKRVIVKEDNEKAPAWKTHVAQAAGEQYDGDLITGACELFLTFYIPRNKGHYGTGRNAAVVKDSAPLYPATKPDTTKLTRGVEDALTGIVWRDDAQVVEQHCRKLYGTPARCEIVVREKVRQLVGDSVHEQATLLAA